MADIKKAIEKLGIKLSEAQIRKLEKSGIVFCHHNHETKWREFSEEDFKNSLRNIILYYFNTPIKDIKSDTPEIIERRISNIKKGIKLIKGD